MKFIIGILIKNEIYRKQNNAFTRVVSKLCGQNT